MDFCSKYGLNYGFEGSDSEEISDDEETIKQLRSNKGDEGGAAEGGAAAASSQKKVMKKVRKADTNVIAVKFDELVCTYNMFAGEPIRCKSCEAIMSEISRKTISSGAGEAKTWTCEFCYVANDISAYTLDQVPTSNDVTFLIEPAPVRAAAEPAAAAAAGGDGAASSSDDNHLGYCIDISGSMDTMIPVKADEAATTTRAASSMTRLNGVKAACLESIENLKQTSPNKRVALLTFSDTLKYYGDSTQGAQPILCVGGGHNRFLPPPQMHFPQQQQRGFIHQVKNVFNISNVSQQQQAPILPVPVEAEIAADIMDNKEKMIALATNQDPNLKPIAQSHASLASRIKALRTEGSTALGPALAFSVGLASHKAGSQVILCTDGCANVGMGTIEGGDRTEKFYEDLADYAKSRGVTVNVISMEGTDCKLALLGKVADKSNGTMNIVNPLKLGEQFKSILENRVVATGVRAKLIVNKYLYIRDEKLEAEELKAAEKNDEAAKEELRKQKKSVIEKEIGNANIDTEITFEYGVRKLSEEEKKNAPELTNVPFQLQIYYVAPDGTKAVRVYTKAQEFTTDRIKAEENLADHRAFFANAAQKESHFALESNIKCAKYKAKTNMNFATRARQAMPQQYMAQNAMMQNWSSEQRSEEMSDIMSNALYAAKKISRNKQN